MDLYQYRRGLREGGLDTRTVASGQSMTHCHHQGKDVLVRVFAPGVVMWKYNVER